MDTNKRSRRHRRKEEDFSDKLFHAVSEDDPRELRWLLDNGADVNHVFFHGLIFISSKPILSLCCEKGRVECAKILIDHGADVKLPDKWGLTPIMYSITVQYTEITKLILEQDPSTTKCRDHRGKSALHFAIDTGNEELIKLVIENITEVDVAERFGITPLMTLCMGHFENERNLLKILLAAGADIHRLSFRSKRSPLQFAAVAKRGELITDLLDAGSDPNQVDSQGRTPLTNLIREHARNQTWEGLVNSGVMSIISACLKAGVDLTTYQSENGNPVHVSVECECPALVRYFLGKGCHLIDKSLLTAVQKGDHSCAKELLSWGSDVNICGTLRPSRNSTDAMELAIQLSHWSIVSTLINAGYDLNKLCYLKGDNPSPKSLLDNPDILNHLYFMSSIPRSLFQIVTLAIWRALGKNIQIKISSLPLPKRIQDLISPQNLKCLTRSNNPYEIVYWEVLP